MATKKAGNKATTHYQQESVGEGLSYYRMVGETYHARRLKLKMQRFFQQKIDELIAAGQPTLKVLDIGCDTGTDLFMLPTSQEITIKRFGTDVSAGAIKQAQLLAAKREEQNITFQMVDANQPQPFPDNSFEVVTASELIEHIENPIDFLNEIYRLLKPNGWAIISTPNEKSFQKFMLNKILPANLGQRLEKSRSEGFARHGASTKLNHADWDNEAHISIYGARQWQKIIAKSKLRLHKMVGSSFYGGMPAFEKSPLLMGSMILLDSLIDHLPAQPHLQTCLIMQLVKESSE